MTPFRLSVLLVGSLSVSAFLAIAQPRQSRTWAPEDRVVLRDYGHVVHVAATNSNVFAATRAGLIVHDPQFDRWLPPVTALDGFPRAETVALLGDPSDETLWIATVDGVVHYLPRLRRFDRVAMLRGVEALMLDAANPFRGIYVRTRREWLLIATGSSVPVRPVNLPAPENRVVSMTLGNVLRRFPAADAMQAMVLSEAGRQYRYTSGAADPMGRNAYFGTDGLGLLRYDGGVARLERLPFGLLADGVGAVVVHNGAVWSGTTAAFLSRAPYTPGFSRVSEDLERSGLDRGPGTIGYGFREVRDIAYWEKRFWAATDAGVVPLDGRRADIIDRSAGLPANDSHALAVTPDGLWVGTSRGLALLGSDGATIQSVEVTIVAGAVINALAAEGRAVWAGGPNGLLLSNGVGRVTTPALAGGEPLLRGPVAALAVAQGRVVMATRDRILWRRTRGQWIRETPFAALAPLTALAGDEDGVWIGGELGVQFFRFDTREFRRVAGPGDLPGLVTDLAASEEYVWVGTEGGLVRLSKRAVL